MISPHKVAFCISLFCVSSNFNPLFSEFKKVDYPTSVVSIENNSYFELDLLDRQIIHSSLNEEEPEVSDLLRTKVEPLSHVINNGLLSVVWEEEEGSHFIIESYEYDSQLLSKHDLNETIEQNMRCIDRYLSDWAFCRGPRGKRGCPGVTGPRGATGATGPDGGAGGLTGATGVAGARGATGLQGAAGIVGATGVTGATGADGATGPTGIAGNSGATGLIGAGGAVGAIGSDGATGLTGTTGATGATGAAGQAMGAGAAGATGATGSTGAQGATGADGLTGVSGATGVGLTGATGPTGAGISGNVGMTGATGAFPNYHLNVYADEQTFGGGTSGSPFCVFIQGLDNVNNSPFLPLSNATLGGTQVTISAAGTYFIYFSMWNSSAAPLGTYQLIVGTPVGPSFTYAALANGTFTDFNVNQFTAISVIQTFTAGQTLQVGAPSSQTLSATTYGSSGTLRVIRLR